MTQQKDARRGPAYRLAVAGRIVLAVLGGYAVAALLTALLSLTLPLVRSEAVASATLVSFAVMVAVVVYVFAARTLGRAALAGAAGNPNARIWCRKFEPELIAIDGLYKAADDLDPSFTGQAVEVRLVEDAIRLALLERT
ncbi:hypothetical protein FV219_22205 [Methylobacterium sp. WL122]|nr:hypothetical protein FV219_22205 [Methylobacterium sp. WL122]